MCASYSRGGPCVCECQSRACGDRWPSRAVTSARLAVLLRHDGRAAQGSAPHIPPREKEGHDSKCVGGFLLKLEGFPLNNETPGGSSRGFVAFREMSYSRAALFPNRAHKKRFLAPGGGARWLLVFSFEYVTRRPRRQTRSQFTAGLRCRHPRARAPRVPPPRRVRCAAAVQN